jgi:hypothetical protein
MVRLAWFNFVGGISELFTGILKKLRIFSDEIGIKV